MLVKHSQASHSSRASVHVETGQATEQETTFFSSACWCMCFSAKYGDQTLLLSYRRIQLPTSLQPRLPGDLVRFMLYLVMGQGWHQTLYSSQRSAGGLGGKGTALQFRFLMKQHNLKREAKNILKRYQSPQSVCWARGRAKLKTLLNLRTLEVTTTAQESSLPYFCPAKVRLLHK